MPLTRAFKATVQARITRDRKYGKELLREGMEYLLAGDLDTGKTILRDYINATIGFRELGRLTKRPVKSLMRMLGPNGNPQARNLFEVIGHLQRVEGLRFEVSLKNVSKMHRRPRRQGRLTKRHQRSRPEAAATSTGGGEAACS